MEVVLDTVWEGLQNALLMAWQVWWALVLGFAISGIVQAWAPRARIERALGGGGARSVALATGLGAASSSCSYAAIAIARSLFARGAAAASSLAFQFASTNLVVELGVVMWVLIGWQFTLAELVGGLVLIATMTLLLRVFVSRRLEAEARVHAERAQDGHLHHTAGTAAGMTLRARLRSVRAWSDVAHNFRNDWAMLHREIAAGLLLAGFVGLLGQNVFNSLFVVDAPEPWRLLENVIVGPVVAVLSFVCSVGNVPLAAVLWSGGIGFGGVIAFVFADLIVLPIVLAYRKYYGSRYTVRIVALMFVTIVIAALIVDGLFDAAGLIPQVRPTRADVFGEVRVDYTLVLNVFATVVFVTLLALTRQRGAMPAAEGDQISVNTHPVSDDAIAELLRLEQRLEAILANLAEAITVMDEHGQMVFANQAAADLLGAGTPEELTSAQPGTIMPRFLVLDEQGRELDLESMPGRRLFAGEHPEPLLVRNIVRATGEERWLMVRSSPVVHPQSGRIEYAVNVFENITEVKRAQLAERSRAQLYTERSRIAHILERSLLPESMPEIPAVEIQARYAPAAGEVNEVGGDFYDVFAYDEGRWMAAIGDVCGKGPRAAGVTALARHTLRAGALSGQSPAEMLDTLHRALRLQSSGAELCTVCLVMIAPEPDHARLTIALAGHLPPLLIDRGGDAMPLGEPGTLLGVVDPIDIVETEAELRDGQTLLLYTDGVPEAGRASGQLGEQGLLTLCAQAPRLTLGGLLEHIERAALEHAAGRLRDDIALLAVRLSM